MQTVKYTDRTIAAYAVELSAIGSSVSEGDFTGSKVPCSGVLNSGGDAANCSRRSADMGTPRQDLPSRSWLGRRGSVGLNGYRYARLSDLRSTHPGLETVRQEHSRDPGCRICCATRSYAICGAKGCRTTGVTYRPASSAQAKEAAPLSNCSPCPPMGREAAGDAGRGQWKGRLSLLTEPL